MEQHVEINSKIVILHVINVLEVYLLNVLNVLAHIFYYHCQALQLVLQIVELDFIKLLEQMFVEHVIRHVINVTDLPT